MIKRFNNFCKREWIFVSVIILVAISLLLVNFDRWRKGTLLFGIAIMFSGIAKLVTKEDRSSIYFIRGKYFDGYLLTILGGLIIYLALTISALGT